MQFDLGDTPEFVIVLENIFEDAAQDVGSPGVRVKRDLGAPGDARETERTEVVETENVVGMPVSVEDGVNAVNTFAQGLRAEVGSGVNKDAMALPLDHDGGAGAAVMRIGGPANVAGAADGRDAHRGTAS